MTWGREYKIGTGQRDRAAASVKKGGGWSSMQAFLRAPLLAIHKLTSLIP